MTVAADIASNRYTPLFFAKIEGLEPILIQKHHRGTPSGWTRSFKTCLHPPTEVSTTLDLGEMMFSQSALTLVLDDIADTDGTSYFGKIFASGKYDQSVNLRVKPSNTYRDQIDADATTIPVKSVVGFPTSGTAYIGQETFTYTGVSTYALTGVSKGLYPAVGSSAYGQTYPRPRQGESGYLYTVSQDPFSWVGRRVALYVTTWDGATAAWNDAETDDPLWVGRIATGKPIKQNGKTRQWQLSCTSILEDLKEKICNNMPAAMLEHINLQGDFGRRFDVHEFAYDRFSDDTWEAICQVTVPKGIYTPESLMAEINSQTAYGASEWTNKNGTNQISVIFRKQLGADAQPRIEAHSLRFGGSLTGYRGWMIICDPDQHFCHALNALGFPGIGTIAVNMSSPDGTAQAEGTHKAERAYASAYSAIHTDYNGSRLYCDTPSKFFADQGDDPNDVQAHVKLEGITLNEYDEEGNAFIEYDDILYEEYDDTYISLGDKMGDMYGISVDIYDEWMVIGATEEAGDPGDTGRAELWKLESGTWTLKQTIQPDSLDDDDCFGVSVAIWDKTIVVGAFLHNEGAGAGAGAAYVFTRPDGSDTWSEQQMLTASDAAASDNYGYSVDVWDDWIIVGAEGESSDKGKAYIYKRTAGVWAEEDTITASDGAASDQFGWSVAISGSTAICGAPHNPGASNAGGAYIFTRDSGGNWTQQQKLPGPSINGDNFGYSVDVWGNSCIVGAPFSYSSPDYAYVFKRAGTTWTQQQRLEPLTSAGGFGIAVKINEVTGTALVAAQEDTDVACEAHVFVRDGASWNEQAHITGDDTTVTYGGGTTSVAMSGRFMVLGGAWVEVGSDANTGQVYTFESVDGYLILDHVHNLYQMTGSAFAAQLVGDEQKEIKQCYIPDYWPKGDSIPRGPFEQHLFSLMSTGVTNYNNSTYDKLPVELGLGFQDDLVDIGSFTTADMMIGGSQLAQRNFYPIPDDSSWFDLVQKDCKLFGFALVQKAGQISLSPILQPRTDLIEIQIDDGTYACINEFPGSEHSVDTVVNRFNIKIKDAVTDQERSYILTDMDSVKAMKTVKEITIEHSGIRPDSTWGNVKALLEQELLNRHLRYPSDIVDVSLAPHLLNRVWVGDIVRLVSNNTNDPTGSGDRTVNILATVIATPWDYSRCTGRATLMLHSRYTNWGLPWAPAAEVSSWDAVNYRLTLDNLQFGESGDPDDGERFSSGDKILIVQSSSYDPDDPLYWQATVDLDYETDGAGILTLETITLTGYDSNEEYFVTFADWTSIVTAQQSLGTWQADAQTTLLDSGSGNDLPHKWG